MAMNDELIMRMWNAEHDQFSRDLGRVLGAMRRAIMRRKTSQKGIDRAYAAGDLERSPRGVGNALLGGLAASVATVALLAVLASLATPQLALGQVTVELAQATQAGSASVAV
jgi:hypothetical protein